MESVMKMVSSVRVSTERSKVDTTQSSHTRHDWYFEPWWWLDVEEDDEGDERWGLIEIMILLAKD